MKTKRTIDINAILVTPAYKGCSSRGADMGRSNLIGGWYRYQFDYGEEYKETPVDLTDKKLHLQRVKFIDGGYDRGGAYWGSPSDLWCGFTKDEQTMIFVRGNDRAEARADVEDVLLQILGQDLANQFEFYQ